jgi:hypothetical protein
MTDDEREDLMRRVRYWLGQSESALDLATAALTRVGELDALWREEYLSDAGVLRGKLDTLREMINNHG